MFGKCGHHPTSLDAPRQPDYPCPIARGLTRAPPLHKHSRRGTPHMLHLTTPTDPEWFSRVRDHMPLILLDHTHLEKRAASTAMSMLFRYADEPRLARALGEVVREEMEHFVRMIDVLEARHIPLERLEPAPYAAALASHARKRDPHALLDKLLIAALIEARSCERFQILAAHIDDPALATLYDELYRDEARHHTLYTQLARQLFDPAEVSARLDELAHAEAQALHASGHTPRLHSA